MDSRAGCRRTRSPRHPDATGHRCADGGGSAIHIESKRFVFPDETGGHDRHDPQLWLGCSWPGLVDVVSAKWCGTLGAQTAESSSLGQRQVLSPPTRTYLISTKFVDAVEGPLAAEAGFFDAAKGGDLGAENGGVDANHPAFQLLGDTKGAAEILGVEIGGQPEGLVVGEATTSSSDRKE